VVDARGYGSGRRGALSKRRSSRGRVVGRLLVPLCRRSAGEHMSVNGEVIAQVGGKGEVWTGCTVRVAYLGSWSAGQARIVHGKCPAGSVPRSRCIAICDVPAWRGVRCTCALVGAKGGKVSSCLSEGECGGLCAGVRVCALT